VHIPRDREGRYYPSFLTSFQRRLVDVGEVAIAPSAAGVSQRKAAEIPGLLLGHRYSHETLSALTDQVLEAAEAFRKRALPSEMAFAYLDGLSFKLMEEGEGVMRVSVYVALGLSRRGNARSWATGCFLRRMLLAGKVCSDSSGSGGWSGCLSSSPTAYRA
jgi:transposase-like protein